MSKDTIKSNRLSCLGIITARGGSKGVIDKNIRDLCGQPTIAYTIDVAHQCPFIDTVMVTTDSSRIRDIALEKGVEAPFLRPDELSSDLAQQEDAIIHAMDWYEKSIGAFDLICLLDPTAPLRRTETLNEGFLLLNSRPDIDAVMSVTECEFPPIKAGELPNDGTLRGFIPDEVKWLNRQEMPDFYRIAGVICISKWDVFREERTFIIDTAAPLIINTFEAMDIDEPLDFFIIDRLLSEGVATEEKLNARINKTSLEK
jgi:CMP-N,N'-diacetyllegionaminic acid synthase